VLQRRVFDLARLGFLVRDRSCVVLAACEHFLRNPAE
jgi:hypothetical protein